MPPDAALPAADPNDTAWHRAALRELTDLAMALARPTQRQALRQAEAELAASEPTPDAATGANAGLLFTRLARAVRQLIALDARLAASQADIASGAAAARARRDANDRRRRRATLAQVRARLVRAIARDPATRETEDLFRDLDDRLADPDIDAALATDSTTALVLRLCTEFAIAPDLADWPDAELALADPDVPDIPRAA